MTTMRERVQELAARREKAKQMGGPEKIKKHHDRGKLTARERMALLYDNKDFVEIGIHGTEMGPGAHDVPADAGPLNSGMLLHRALQLMRAVSPGYLQHFIAYADTLSSLEQLQQAVAPLTTASDAPAKPKRAPRKRKPAAT